MKPHPRPYHRIALAALDGLVAAAAFVAAYLLGFDVGRDPQFAIYAQQIAPLLPVVIALRLGGLWFFGLYRGLARYASITELLALAKAVALGTVALVFISYSLRLLPSWMPLPADDTDTILRLPWRILIIDAAFALLGLGALRFGRRVLLVQQAALARRERVVVVGEGKVARAAIHQMINAPEVSYAPVALLQPSEEHGEAGEIYGVPIVRAPIDELETIISDHDASHVLVAPDSPDPSLLRRAIRATSHGGVRFHLLPSVESVMRAEPGRGARLRDVRLEDLLQREEVDLHLPEEANYVAEQTVLVTGAGGSIGAELVRQLVELRPLQLVLIGRGENSLYELQQDLREYYEEAESVAGNVVNSSKGGDNTRIVFLVQDAGDTEAMSAIFAEYRPSVVFHAAAHKHVPLMEDQPAQALANNSLATARLARLAADAGVERFVFISTDKAVRPTSVMGASKRLAERGVWAVAERLAGAELADSAAPPSKRRRSRGLGGSISVKVGGARLGLSARLGDHDGGDEDGTSERESAKNRGGDHDDLLRTAQCFCAVRFGNVLGSRGSVVPTLRKQIERGGPVRLTDPMMTRFFMSGQEAARLVILVGALGRNGFLYLLDMGEPVRIEQLARDMIRLLGYAPDEIEIRFTGRRPGEKICEELITEGENVEPTEHPKIFESPHEALDLGAFGRSLDALERLLEEGAPASDLRAFLQREIDDYSPADSAGPLEDDHGNPT